MRILFDTHLLVWFAVGDQRTSKAARALLDDPQVEPVFSIVSIWEATIKFGLRREDFLLHPQLLHSGLKSSGFTELGLSAAHSFALLELPTLHRDPFDRILIAQSRAEGIVLATADKTVASYGGLVRLV